jgi:hypothetical protein
MEAVPAEPSRSTLSWFVRTESPDEVDGCRWVHSMPARGSGGNAVYIVGSAGDQVAYTCVSDSNQSSRRLKRLLDATRCAQSAVLLLDGLDEHEDADRPLILHFSGHGRPDTASQVDFVLGNLQLQCKSSNDAMWAESSAHSNVLPSDDCTAPPGWVLLSASETDALSSAASDVDAGTNAHRRALPRYGDQPFALRTCCGISTLTPEAVLAAWIPKQTFDLGTTRAERFYSVGMHLFSAPITATIRDKRFVQDYREGLRRFLSGGLALLRLMVVTLLAALSHLARTPALLLVMLATARRYGRRGDDDSHLMSAPTWHPIRTRGAACPAA